MIDAHCHLQDEKFAGKVTEVIGRAKEAGVVTMICNGSGVFNCREVLRIAEENEGVWATVGIHPEEMGEIEGEKGEEVYRQLLEMSKHPKVVAIGEAGLDYQEGSPTREKQIELFKINIRLGKETGLPLVVHNRNANKDVEELLKDYKYGGQLHCFVESEEFMKKMTDRGWYISLGGIVTFKKRDTLREVVKLVPEDKLLIESDAPWLAPEPIRGQINEPANVKIVAEAIASVRNVTTDRIEEVTTANAKRLFKI